MNKLNMVIGQHSHDDRINVPQITNHMDKRIDNLRHYIFIPFRSQENYFVLKDYKIDQN